MTDFALGRNPQIGKWINWASFSLGGALFFANIHFSALYMKASAQASAVSSFVPAMANGDILSTVFRYTVALCVSFACLLISGVFLHPNGLPTIFGELRKIEARGVSKVLGMIVTIVAVSALAYGGYWAYRYDLQTTMMAFGTASLWSVAAFPVWLCIVGPEFFFHATHLYGRLIGGSAPKAAIPGGAPKGKPAAMPGMSAGMQIPGMGRPGLK